MKKNAIKVKRREGYRKEKKKNIARKKERKRENEI
jgi:hypothetical protein